MNLFIYDIYLYIIFLFLQTTTPISLVFLLFSTLLGKGSVRNGLVSRDDWKSIPWGVVCELISLMDSQTMPAWTAYSGHSDFVGPSN